MIYLILFVFFSLCFWIPYGLYYAYKRWGPNRLLSPPPLDDEYTPPTILPTLRATAFSSVPDWYNLRHDLAKCAGCEWEGPITSCESYKESESWEIPKEYTVLVCPVCSLHNDDGLVEYTWSSIAALFDSIETAEKLAKEKNKEERGRNR